MLMSCLLFNCFAYADSAQPLYKSPEARDSMRLLTGSYNYQKDPLAVLRRRYPDSEFQLFEDFVTGFRAILRTYMVNGHTQIEVAIKGVSGFPSGVAALSMGFTQSGSQGYRDLLVRVKEIIQKAPGGAASVDLSVSGHSMGGALAQLFAYQNAKLNSTLGGVFVRTWNGLGGMDLIENNEGYDATIAARIRCLHIRLNEDMIARTGRHLPGTYLRIDTPKGGHRLARFIPFVIDSEVAPVSSEEPQNRVLVEFSRHPAVRDAMKKASRAGIDAIFATRFHFTRACVLFSHFLFL